LNDPQVSEELAHWRRELDGAPDLLDLPTDRPHPVSPSHRSGELRFTLPRARTAALQAFAEAEGADLFVLLVAGFQALLGRLTGQDDLLLGSVVSSRVTPVANLVVLRGRLEGEPSCRQWLARVQATTRTAYAHAELPFETLVEALNPSRSGGRHPLVQAALAWEEAVPTSLAASLELGLQVTVAAGELIGRLVYAQDLFDPGTVARFAGYLERLLAGFGERPEERLQELPLLSAAERTELTIEWSGAAPTPYPRESTLVQLFAEQTALRPDSVAIDGMGLEMTYGELHRRAGRLAARLVDLGLEPESRVALLLPQGPALVVAMLAVVLAGGAYVPLDLGLPEERLAFLLADTGAPVLLTEENQAHRVPPKGPVVLCLDGPAGALPPAYAPPAMPAMPATVPESLAHVIYTSGSTGIPKGVAIPHRGVVRLVREAGYLRLTPGDRVAQVANPAFDAATFEIWGALLNGARLLLIDREVALSPDALQAALQRHQVSVLLLTTSLFHQVAALAAMPAMTPEGFGALDHLLFGGEAADPAAVRRVLETGLRARLLNLYGPTESTTVATWFCADGLTAGELTMPIGHPIANTSVYVLDRRLGLAPVGVPGELYIGGDGLARGYLGRPELTAERFLPSPGFGGIGGIGEGGAGGERLYRSGDLVRRRADGAIEFLGRIDGQIKLRGFRIELGEIEVHLRNGPGVREAAVLALPDGERGLRLVAFVGGEPGSGPGNEPAPAALRAFLKDRLPAYMVPAAFVFLDALPLNANGKADRRALAALDVKPDATETEIAGRAPGTPIEELVAGIWSEVLDIPRLGADDDFFALGGHSLLATQVVSRVRDVFGVELSLGRLFAAPTLCALAAEIAAARDQGGGAAALIQPAPPIRPTPRDVSLPLSFAQERLWFLDLLRPGSAAYNIPAALRLRGHLKVPALAAALAALVERHEPLRTTFLARDGRPFQVIAPRGRIALPVVDLRGLGDAERDLAARRLGEREARLPFDLAAGPLLRATLLCLAAGEREEHLLLLTLHHIAGDGWSVGVFFRELKTLYAAHASCSLLPTLPALPALPIQYADYAIWQRGWLSGEVLAGQIAWWRESLAGAPARLDLPVDRPRPAIPRRRGATVPLALAGGAGELGRDLAALSRRSGATLFMTLLAGFATLLSRLTGEERLAVGSPVANRTRTEVEGLIGFFVNTLALAVDLRGEPTFAALLVRVRDLALGAYAHQDLPFERLVEELRQERHADHSPIFQVMLVLQNAPPPSFELPGLTLTGEGLAGGTAKFDLTLSFGETANGGLTGTFEYDSDLFDRATVERWAGHLSAFLAAAAANPGRPLSELSPWSAAELQEIRGRQRGPRESPKVSGGEGEGGLQARLAAREEKVAGLRSSLSEKKRALLGKLVAGRTGGSPPVRETTIPRRPEPGPAVLSFGQERLWFLDLLQPESPFYNIPLLLRLAGRQDLPAFVRSVREIVRRHETLRTTFVSISSGPRQVVAQERPVAVPIVDLRPLPTAAREAEARRLAVAEAGRPFDLARGPLLRTTFVRLAETDGLAFFNLHHIVGDGWSMGLLVSELASLYPAFVAGGAGGVGAKSPLPELPIQYADFATWQRKRLAGELLAREIAHWRQELAGAPDLLNLPTDRPRPPVQSFRGNGLSFTLPRALATALGALAQSEGATLFMVLLAGFQALLGRLTGQEDLLAGTAVANRTPREVEGLIGFFANMLPLRGRMTGEPSCRETLARVKTTSLAAYAHQDLPIELLVEELRLAGIRGYNPLVQALLVLQNAPRGALELPGLTLRAVDAPVTTAVFDLALAIFELGGELGGQLDYATDLFDPSTAARLAGHFERLLAGFVAAPERRLWELPLLSPVERAAILAEWNDSGIASPGRPDGRMPRAMEIAARRIPDAVAVVDRGGQLSYGEFNRRANRLAWRLRSLGVGPEVPVAVCAERSAALVTGFLAVLKAGGAYVPLDPTHPPARLALVLADIATGIARPVVLVTESLRERLPVAPIDDPRVVLSLTATQRQDGEREDDPPPLATPGHRANIIYTSGSTGTPKGVEVPHAGLTNVISHFREVHEPGPGDRFSQVANPTFDAAALEIWSCFVSGATLVIPDEATRAAPDKLIDWLVAESITISNLTTALAMAVFAQTGAAWPPGTALRVFHTGGESLHSIPRGLPFGLWNLYGPTECSIIAATARVAGGEALPPIGRPVANSRVYILDRLWQQAPPGFPGELSIGGAIVARGYLGWPARTAERFVPDPWSGEPGARLYRTGDLARWRPDGQLDFLGRFDGQVKIRGFRIELGEIEAALAAHPGGVREAVVVPWKGRGEERASLLVAYVVPRSGGVSGSSSGGGSGGITAADLRSYLKSRLPEFMVPSSFLLLPELPLTPNGKVDRRALPEPVFGRREEGEEWEAEVASRTPAEELLAELWSEILGVGPVGLDDNFFELGGHSLLVARVVARVREVFKVELPVRTLFDLPTVAGLAAWLSVGRGETLPPPLAPLAPMLPAGGGAERPLSFAQERLWFLDRLEPGGGLYNIGTAVRLVGRLDVVAFAAALGEIVRRHEALRTGFREGRRELAGRPAQVVEAWSPLGLPVVDLSALSGEPGGARATAVRRLALEEAARDFDLARGRPLRATLARLQADSAGGPQHVLLLTLHHIAADGGSVGIFVRELGVLYEAFRAGRPSPLPELPIQYGDFAVWQRSWLSGAALAAQTAYWRQALGGAPTLELPTDRPRPTVRSPRGAHREMALPPGLTENLLRWAREQVATPFMVLLAAFEALLGRWSGQEDVLVGTPIANRNHREIEGLIGFFVNTLVLRGDLSGDPAFRTLVARTREATLGAYAHQDLPFEKLVEELAPVRDGSRTPLFQVMFTLQNAAASAASKTTPGFGDLIAEGLEVAGETAKFDLTLSLLRGGERGFIGGLMGDIEYSTDLFDASTMLRLGGQLETLLAAMMADPDRRLAELPLLSKAERHQLEIEWNAPPQIRDAGRATLQARLGRQATETPDAVAVVAGETRLTYGELAASAARVGRRLAAVGAGPGTDVGLSFERSPELVVGLLGILAAGGSYVPIDPTYPAERRDFMLRDAGLAAVVNREWLDAPGESAESGARPLAARLDDSLYVIYTSGSTGQPKGARVRHGAFLGLVDWYIGELGMHAADRVLLLSSASFDLTQKNFFAPLFVGAELHLAPSVYDPLELRAQVERQGITRINGTPSAFYPLAEEGDPAALASLRTVILGGEPIAVSRLDRWRRSASCQASVINSYGPTECTDVVAFHRLGGSATVPLGRPVPGARLWIAGGAGEPAPIGVPGELWIGGECVGFGYLGDAARTAEKFLPDPFSRIPGERAYRTGDLARRLPGGEIDYLGRIDSQIKVRGFRVELGEIESALAAQPGVREAVVVAREIHPDRPGDLRLVAYVVPEEGVELLLPALREALAAHLPQYMVPASFVVLAALPLTPSGKVDRRALTLSGGDDGSEGRGEGAEFLAPRTPVEELLAGVWGELLHVSRVGVRDDFFALGGHSLLATQLASRLRAAFGVEVPLRRIFDAPTLAGMAAEIEGARQGSGALAETALVAIGRGEWGERGERAGLRLPLSFAQERLWFLDRFDPGNPSLNIPLAVALSGRLSIPALGAALGELVARQESFRTTFESLAGEPSQTIHPAGSVVLPAVDLTALPEDRGTGEADRLLGEQSFRGFDLERGPLYRAVLLRLAEDRHRFLLVLHHIISDGWSMGVLVRELGAIYDALSQGERPRLPPLPIQYADFALWQRRALAGEKRQDLDAWLSRLGGDVEPLELPTDRPRPAVQTYRGGRWSFVLPAGLSSRLRDFGRRESATLFMTLLATAKALFQRQSGQDDILIGTPIAGRRRIETEGLIGFFLNTLVLRTDLSGTLSFRELVARVREVTLEAYSRQDVPFEAVLAGLKGERDLSRTPLFQVLFNLLNLPRGELRLPDLTLQPLSAPEDAPSKFDLTFYVTELGEEIGIDLVYNADLFDAARMADLAAQYAALLAQVVENPQLPLATFSLVTERARAVLPDPRAELDAGFLGSVHELFAREARRAPGRVALSGGEGAWTYGELDAVADRLASWLLAQGLAREDRVAIYAHRSAPLVPAVLAALKAGGAFTMLDPSYPAARLVDVLTLASPRALLLVAAAGSLPPEVEAWRSAAGCPRLVLPGGGPEVMLREIPGGSSEFRPIAVGPDDLAYIAFTSGSTGAPKGILGRHGPLTHFLPFLKGHFGLSAEDRFTLLSGLAHDPLQRDIFTPLCLGATLLLPDPDDIPVPGRIGAWMAREGATVAHLTPAMAQLLTELPAGEEPPTVPSLRLVLLVGEALTRRDVARIRRLAPAVTAVNLFGSTETQRAVGYHAVTEEEASASGRGRQVLALGRGMKDVQLLVLSATGELAGIGEVGEIVVRSPHLARGYLNDPTLSAERFRLNPATGRAGDRLYHSGDLGRYLPNGEVTFAGRGDFQVKIRGFRVEPAEIEAALARHPAVAAAAALLAEERGERFLVALVVPRRGAEPTPAELREHLLAELPSYMVPAAFARLAALPLTPNGKLDRRALKSLVPALAEMVGEGSGAGYTAPRDATEELLAGLWGALLGLDRVGIDDNFFALGGHSLLATRLVSRIREVFGVELPVRALFDAPTVAGLAGLLAALLVADTGGEPAPQLRPADRPASGSAFSDEEFPLSFAQERLWFLDRLAPGEGAYNISAAVRLMGPLDVAAFGAALNEIVRRHEALRTRFGEGALGQPVQSIGAWSPRGLPVIDLSALSGNTREAVALRLARKEAGRPFDLTSGRLARATLLRLDASDGSAEHVLLLTLHHIASDGWSLGVLVGELGTLYGAFRSGRPSPLPALPIQYADFAVWQRAWLSGAVLDAQMAYWRQALVGAPTLELPTDRPRPAVRSARGTRRRAALSKSLSADLRRLAQEQGATPFMVLLAAFEILLGRLSGQDDLLVGSPIANRTRREVEGLIGFFVNTLVLRADLSGDPDFRRYLGRTREVALAAYAHQDLPFEKLVSELSPVRDTSRTPLFQVMFNLQTAAAAAVSESNLGRGFPGLSAERLEIFGENSQLDLTLALSSGGESPFAGSFEYSTDLFDGTTIERLHSSFQTLLTGIVADPDARLADLPLLTAPERAALLVEWNDTGEESRELPGENVPQAIEERARRVPDAVAVVASGGLLSYGELDRRSNRLAHHLRGLGVGPEILVGVAVERSLFLMIGLLGILKAGGAYVPLDPEYPQERLASMLEQSCPAVLLTEEKLASTLPATARKGAQIVLLDRDGPAIERESDRAVTSGAGPENLAYLLYTSGSTGRPKGVQISHGALTNFLAAMSRRPGLASADVLLAVTTLSFDIAGLELYLPLLAGAQVVLVPRAVALDGERLRELLVHSRATVMQATPATWRLLLEAGWRGDGTLTVLCGGEALPRDLAEALLARSGALWNLYGPTETTIWSTLQKVSNAGRISIGRPLANTQIHLLSRGFLPVPLGAPGELHIGGAGLARGYRDRPDLTAERFLPDPAATAPGARVYGTGDLARHLPDGSVEYLGRIDHQVKIRGFRIELGEIEAALTADPGVREAVVVAREASPERPGDLRLVAYVVPRGALPALQTLRAGLAGRLPYYMLPTAFVVLAALPLTPNGKVDRRALPSPDLSPAERETRYEAPRPGPEESLAAIWVEVLDGRGDRVGRVGRVGRHDNFFALGGDSLLAIRIVTRAREVGLTLTVLQLFERQTIAELADLPQISAAQAAPEPEALPESAAAQGPDVSGADFDPDDLARFLAELTGG
jgi:amino acid adenylation domain-containing protein